MALYTAIAVGVASLTSSIVTAVKAKKRAKKRDEQADAAQDEVARLEGARQEVINPYDQMEGLGMMVSNPFASLQVGEDTGWKTESFKIPADNNHNKVYSIQFRISQGISEPVGFELNDISVVYRLRSPGIEAPTTESETIIYSELPSDPAEPGGDGFRS